MTLGVYKTDGKLFSRYGQNAKDINLTKLAMIFYVTHMLRSWQQKCFSGPCFLFRCRREWQDESKVRFINFRHLVPCNYVSSNLNIFVFDHTRLVAKYTMEGFNPLSHWWLTGCACLSTTTMEMNFRRPQSSVPTLQRNWQRCWIGESLCVNIMDIMIIMLLFQ